MDIFGFEDGGLFDGNDLFDGFSGDGLIETHSCLPPDIDPVSFVGNDIDRKRAILEDELKEANRQVEYYAEKLVDIAEGADHSQTYANNCKASLASWKNEVKDIEWKLNHLK